jgi:hypothetical protein
VDEKELQRFTIEEEINRRYRLFNAVGTRLTVRLQCPHEGEDLNHVYHFPASVSDLFEYALRNCDDSDMVGITINNQENVQDKAIKFSFRRKDQIIANLIWSVLRKVAQSNARFNALDKLVLTIHYVKMPVGKSKGIPTKGRPLATMVRLKKDIVKVKAEENYLTHALIIAIARLINDPDYNAFRQGNKIRLTVDRLLRTTGIDLTNGGGIPELIRFQEHFKEYRIVLGGLNCKDIMFDGQVQSEKRINLLYNDVTHHYHVINSMTVALSR